MSVNYGVKFTDMFGPQFLSAAAPFRAVGFDPLRSPGFWESLLATTLGGKQTGHRCEHDVEIEIGGNTYRIECKYSSQYYQRYTPVNGRDYSRHVFKWAKPRGGGGKTGVNALVLIGLTPGDVIYSWCVPRDAIEPGCKSITVAAPEERRSTTYGRWDAYMAPFDAIVGAVMRVCLGYVGVATRPANHAKRRARRARREAERSYPLFPGP